MRGWGLELPSVMHTALWQKPLSSPDKATRQAGLENLRVTIDTAKAVGATTVLVVPHHTREVFREDWELEGSDALHVDHVTDDLADFLERLAQTL